VLQIQGRDHRIEGRAMKVIQLDRNSD